MQHFPFVEGPEAVVAIEHQSPHPSSTGLNLNGCTPLQRIKVNTRSSVYELIVLNARRGRVLVRGGRVLPKFRRATFAGSTAGGTALKQNTIDIGLRMEFHVGKEIVLTSAVQAVDRESIVGAVLNHWTPRLSQALL